MCVFVCNLETSTRKLPRPDLDCCATEKKSTLWCEDRMVCSDIIYVTGAALNVCAIRYDESVRV